MHFVFILTLTFYWEGLESFIPWPRDLIYFKYLYDLWPQYIPKADISATCWPSDSNCRGRASFPTPLSRRLHRPTYKVEQIYGYGLLIVKIKVTEVKVRYVILPSVQWEVAYYHSRVFMTFRALHALLKVKGQRSSIELVLQELVHEGQSSLLNQIQEPELKWKVTRSKSQDHNIHFLRSRVKGQS